ncbi:alkene reductase [Streptomyces sp. NPDC005146]
MTTSPTLWQPFALGRIKLPHRLAMAPMTRSRALPDGTPTELMAEYYGQRASLGLIISEGAQPSEDGQGYPGTPGIHTPEHVEGWRRIAEATHAGGGALFVQLMHVGRISHPDNTPHHRQPVAPSAISAGQDMITASGMQKTPVPRELATGELAGVVAEFRHAAAMAVEAGADGVEIHAANGYLLHQFLSPNANHRSDGYGGSVEARSRFVVEVAAAVAEEIGADGVGIRISPGFPLGGIDEGDEEAVRAQYRHLVGELAPLDLAYMHIHHLGDEELLRSLREAWPAALLVLRYGRTREELAEYLDSGLADVAPVGRWALANPDLVERLRLDAPLTEADPATLYGGGAAGYTDYPTLAGA